MTWLSTTAYGDPRSCRAAANTLRLASESLERTALAARDARTAAPTWEGRARLAYSSQSEVSERVVHTHAARVAAVAAALDRFATTLASVQNDLNAARAAAAGAGCVVTSTGVDVSGAGAAGTAVAASVADARRREMRAHAALGQALERSRGESAFENLMEGLGLAVPDNADRADRAYWAYGLSSLTADLGANLYLERIASSTPDIGRHLSEEARAAQWAAREASHANVIGKVTGPVGTALTVGFAAKGQWVADRDNKSLSRADRVGRTVVRAGLGGGAVISGGIAGAQIGGAIGTFIPIPGVGTGVGAAVGAAVGSFAASKAGASTADAAVEAVDDVIDVAVDLGESIEDGATEAADTARDVGEKICFWD